MPTQLGRSPAAPSDTAGVPRRDTCDRTRLKVRRLVSETTNLMRPVSISSADGPRFGDAETSPCELGTPAARMSLRHPTHVMTAQFLRRALVGLAIRGGAALLVLAVGCQRPPSLLAEAVMPPSWAGSRPWSGIVADPPLSASLSRNWAGPGVVVVISGASVRMAAAWRAAHPGAARRRATARRRACRVGRPSYPVRRSKCVRRFPAKIFCLVESTLASRIARQSEIIARRWWAASAVIARAVPPQRVCGNAAARPLGRLAREWPRARCREIVKTCG